VCEKGLGQYVERGRYNKFKQDTLKIVTLNLKLKNYKISDNNNEWKLLHIEKDTAWNGLYNKY
jgi:hypothetical protein